MLATRCRMVHAMRLTVWVETRVLTEVCHHRVLSKASTSIAARSRGGWPAGPRAPMNVVQSRSMPLQLNQRSHVPWQRPASVHPLQST